LNPSFNASDWDAVSELLDPEVEFSAAFGVLHRKPLLATSVM